MSLAEIRQMFDFVARPQADCGDINRLIDEQLARVRARLKSMCALEEQLSRLRARCGAGFVAAKCGILHELAAAAHGEACACHTNVTQSEMHSGSVTTGSSKNITARAGAAST